jgi:Spy/CpxP family protein refolding chaperone
MKTSTKIIAAAAAAVALGAGGLVFAQQGQGHMGHTGAGMGMHGGGHGGMRGAESAADVTARLATVKIELKITAAQEPAWQKFEGVVRQQADARQAMRSTMQARMQDPNAAAGVDHAAQRESMMTLREGNRAERDAARQALYAVLTPEQRTLADQKLSAGQGHRMGTHKHAG